MKKSAAVRAMLARTAMLRVGTDRPLTDLVIRVERDGRPISARIEELAYLTNAEIDRLSWGAKLREWLAHDEAWAADYARDRWINRDPDRR